MESLRELYKIGPGPSSSHTLAPWRAAHLFMEAFSEAVSFDVELYGSLSLTGKGHFTDQILIKAFAPKYCKVLFRLHWAHEHPHGMLFKAYDAKNRNIGEWTVFSLGGGSIRVLEADFDFQRTVYHETSMAAIMDRLQNTHQSLPEYVLAHEPDVEAHLSEMLEGMFAAVKRGLQAGGVLPGLLEVPRVAKSLHLQAQAMESDEQRHRLNLVAYAYANNEENAASGPVITAPTLGASGVMAALMHHLYYDKAVSRQKLVNAMMVGGMFGNLVKTNATISGAQGGCQAEIGTACAMAAAALAYVEGHGMDVIEYAAEIAMEHHLGLTCDPVGGYVIIPCIERNGAAVLRAVDAVLMASTIGQFKKPRVNFDTIVRTMNYTGQKIALELRETSLGGLAQEIKLEP